MQNVFFSQRKKFFEKIVKIYDYLLDKHGGSEYHIMRKKEKNLFNRVQRRPQDVKAFQIAARFSHAAEETRFFNAS